MGQTGNSQVIFGTTIAVTLICSPGDVIEVTEKVVIDCMGELLFNPAIPEKRFVCEVREKT